MRRVQHNWSIKPWRKSGCRCHLCHHCQDSALSTTRRVARTTARKPPPAHTCPPLRSSASPKLRSVSSPRRSTGDGHKIALFFSGRQHAGENLKDVLVRRAKELPPPTQMCDALSRNLPGELQTILDNCLAHGRRRFTDVFDHFPDECQHVLEALAIIYHNDELARQQEMSADDRLLFHQRESGPVMGELHLWLARQLNNRLVEPNSALCAAISYLLKHWEKLTLFLRVAGRALGQQYLRTRVEEGNPTSAQFSVLQRSQQCPSASLGDRRLLGGRVAKLADAEQNHPADLALDSPYLLDLLPDRWALAHPKSVRKGRREDRETVLDAKCWRGTRARIEAVPSRRPAPRRGSHVSRSAPPALPVSTLPPRFGPCPTRTLSFYKTCHGAHVGDIFMSLIHTCELNGANPFDYLISSNVMRARWPRIPRTGCPGTTERRSASRPRVPPLLADAGRGGAR